MDIVQLGQLALERSNSSRMAVKVMGELSETWGYADAAESLLVIDPMEAFIFQIMPDDTGNSSLWVAQRVPDDHVGAVTNGLTVRVVDFQDSVNFLSSGTYCKGGSCGLRAVAKRHGLWAEGEPLDFARTFAKGGTNEPSEGAQLYVSRRMWTAYRRFGGPPLPTDITDFIMDAPYPATVPVPKGSVGLQDVMGVMRDYYEGTAFDMTQGMAAGPFGSPDRFGGNKNVTGGWERTIATHHSIVSLVMEARSWLPDPVGGTLWFAPHAAHTSVYAPFPCGMDVLPASYTNGSGWGTVDSGVAAWANRAVFGAVQARFQDSIKEVVAARTVLDNNSLALQASTDAAVKAGTMSPAAVGALFGRNADAIVAGWWALHNTLIHTATKDCGYPQWWLQAKDVDYSGGPLERGGEGGVGERGVEGGSAQAECVRSKCASRGGKDPSKVELACVMRCLD
jgi:dipeptidase